MVKLITTDSYFNLFDILNKELSGKVNTLGGKNLIFCEEKISLMAERSILSRFNGSFNTSVYSFGNFLRAKTSCEKALTKEGSAMAVKRVLSSVPLTCLKASRTSLAPALFDLIIQLKSAKVKPSDLLSAAEQSSGTLKNKLIDVAEVYSGYERFISDSGFDDQSSLLNYLPQIIYNDNEVKGSNVYIVGFNGFTSQIRSAILALLKTANTVTAILTQGQNQLLYVNETADSFASLVEQAGLVLTKQVIDSDFTLEGKVISQSLFSPSALNAKKIGTDKIFTLYAENKMVEAERVAEIIRQKVSSGECRFKDVTVALVSPLEYQGEIERAFNMLELPFFIDQKKKVASHPLIRLIISYVDAFRKNLERNALSSFYKNPLFEGDKSLTDEFENYTLAYNVDFARFKKPFIFDGEGRYDLQKLNDFRQRVVDCFNFFNPKKLLEELKVQTKLLEYSEILADIGEMEERAVNDQIYCAVERILTEIEMMLGQTKLELLEFKKVFVSGITAMELSIIPQYNDAVFVGGLKEAALAKAKYLFVLGLTSDCPAVKEDVALLSDNEINQLEQVKVLVEPKIKVVNHRARENAGLALCAFDRALYLSYPTLNVSGDKTVKSEMLTQIENIFTVKPFPKYNGYLSYKQGLSAFARACGEFATGKINDFTYPSSFYSAVDGVELQPLLNRSKTEIKLRLDSAKEIMAKKYISPTRIEDFYKCPYRAFLSRGLKLQRREVGLVDGLSVGNIMHEIFSEYALNMKNVTDKESSNSLVKDIAKRVFAKPKYARYLTDAVTLNFAESAVEECAKFCYKNYLAMKNSTFSVDKTETSFGDGKDCHYPAIELRGGKVKMTGKIDRVDKSQGYYRVLDYKTGGAGAYLDQLFTGKKLQLYLYAKAVSQKLKDSKLAGVYYLPVSDKFRREGEEEPKLSKGVTLSDEKSIKMQDEKVLSGQGLFLQTVKKGDTVSIEGEHTQEGLNAMVNYAVKISELAVKRMAEGVIVPSPCSDTTCSYCDYKSLCPLFDPQVREYGKVDATTIIDAVKGDTEDA